MRFRAPRLDEAERLSGFMRELFVEAYRHCSTPQNVDAFLAATYRPERQAAELADADVETVLVEDADGEWLGFAQVRFAAATPDGVTLARGAELGRIYLAARAQGRGVGVALLREVERRARARGRDGLWLNVWQEAPQALAFYQRDGCTVVGPTDFVVGDDAKTDWRMAKRFATKRGAPQL